METFIRFQKNLPEIIPPTLQTVTQTARICQIMQEEFDRIGFSHEFFYFFYF